MRSETIKFVSTQFFLN